LAKDGVRAWMVETIAVKCPIGYALAVSDEDEGAFSSFELKRLYLFYRFHGNRLGKKLLEAVLSFAKEERSERIWLQVHEANNHAIEFYRRFGFVQMGTDVFRAGKVLSTECLNKMTSRIAVANKKNDGYLDSRPPGHLTFSLSSLTNM